MITALLIIHGLMAVALLGAITHQAISVCMPRPRPADSFVARVRAVTPAAYVGAIVVLYIATFILGAIIYPEYRMQVRIVLEQQGLRVANGAFELKEHFLAVGLGALPAYWHAWHQRLDSPRAGARTALTLMLAFVVWWSFLAGHIVNNIRGFGL
jgi:hypothetical protein